MNAIYLTLFVSLILLACAILLYISTWVRRDHEHNDRLSLLPLQGDDEKNAMQSRKER